MKQAPRSKVAIVCLLVSTFILSQFPLSFAGQTQNSSRRNKNDQGQTTSKPAESSQAGKTQSNSAKSDSQDTSKEPTDRVDNRNSRTTSSDDNEKLQNDSPTTFDDPRLNQAKEKREALPFDRPPLGSQGSSTSAKESSPKFDRPSSTSSPNTRASSQRSSGATDNERPTIRSQSPQSSNSSGAQQRYPTNQPTYDQNDGDSSGRNHPPVLRRDTDTTASSPADTDSNTNSSRGVPPVLHRPTDSRETPSGTPQQPGWSQNTNRDMPQNGNNSPQKSSSGEDETIKLDSTLVNIPLLVSDRSNRYIPKLTARDFLLYEDGIQQDIAFFGNEEVPFSVVLMLDMSPSVEGNSQAIQDAALAFVRQLRSQDRVMIVSFDRHIDYLTDFTSDRYQLERAIHSVSTGSGTSVYDAVYEVISRRLRNVEGRKALILFSDGEDTTSKRASYDDVIGLISESDVLTYGLRYPSGDGNIRMNPWPRSVPRMPVPLPLPFPWPFPRRRGPFGHFVPQSVLPNNAPAGQWPRRGGNGGDFMSDVANAGGGAVYDAKQVGDMRDLAYKIAEELRHVYVVSYYPTNALANGGFRAIRIRVKGRDDIAVRHRKGYNARDVARGSKI